MIIRIHKNIFKRQDGFQNVDYLIPIVIAAVISIICLSLESKIIFIVLALVGAVLILFSISTLSHNTAGVIIGIIAAVIYLALMFYLHAKIGKEEKSGSAALGKTIVKYEQNYTLPKSASAHWGSNRIWMWTSSTPDIGQM
jgi:hypothetical protein